MIVTIFFIISGIIIVIFFLIGLIFFLKNKGKIIIANQCFDLKLESFFFKWEFSEIADMKELKKLSNFNRLKFASFAGTNLNDEGLSYVSELTQIDYLDLQETQITNEGLQHLIKLKRLKHLRLKDNPQLTNECIKYIKVLESLEDLQIHETGIDETGLKEVIKMNSLKDITVDIWDDNFTHKFLLELSKQMPNCTILAKGYGEFHKGYVRIHG